MYSTSKQMKSSRPGGTGHPAVEEADRKVGIGRLRTRLKLARRVTSVLGCMAILVASSSAGQVNAAAPAAGLHVAGNRLLASNGSQVILRGANRPGTEYMCIHGWGIFDGPSDDASIQAMSAWHMNAVRVPLNEDCWLGINNSPAADSGTAYRAAIAAYVRKLHHAGMYAILDLHWTAAGTAQALAQHEMPDADHATDFWKSVATSFKSDGSTVFDLFNEPYGVSWTCWRDGGDCGVGYQVVGMQALVDAVRSTGARNPVLVGGLSRANDLSSWLTYPPKDSTGNLMASWHSYSSNTCNNEACWTSKIAPVAARVPLVTGEMGESDCAHGYVDALLPWLDKHSAGYLGWGWTTPGPAGCQAGSSFYLITDYKGTPSSYGAGLRNHLASIHRHKSGSGHPKMKSHRGSRH